MIAGQSRLRLVRRSARALVFLAVICCLFLLTFADAAWLRSRRAPGARAQAELAKRLGLTDLCSVHGGALYPAPFSGRSAQRIPGAPRRFRALPQRFARVASGAGQTPCEPGLKNRNT